MKPKAYSYVRFSTPEQEKGDSLRRQTEASERYARENGLALDYTLRLTDRGLSAFNGYHRTKGALGEFLRLVEHGAVPDGSVLLVESLDRLSREQVLDALTQFTGIIRAGVKVVTLADGMEYDTKSVNANFGQLLMSLVIMSRAHEESAVKSKRAKAAWSEKRSEAAHDDRLKLTGRCPEWLELPELPKGVKRSQVRSEFKVLPERAQVVNQIFEMKLAGKGSGLIARELNESGVWKPKNGWRKSYVNKILRSRSVIGEFQPHKKIKVGEGEYKRVPEGEPISDYYPAVVDKALFDQVQALVQHNRELRGQAGGRNGAIGNLFGHLAVCSKCGGPMAYLNKGKTPKGGQYLQCDKGRRGLGCSRKTIRYDRFEPMVLTYAKGLDASDILPGNEKRLSELSVLRNQLQAADGDLGSLKGEIDNVLDSIATTPNRELRTFLERRASTMLTRKTELEGRKTSLQSQVEKLSNATRETEQRLASIKELIGRMDMLNAEARVDIRLSLRTQLRRLIERVEISQGIYRWNGCEWQSFKLTFRDGTSRTLLLGKSGDLWQVHDRDKAETTYLYHVNSEGNVIDVDVEYPEAEAARLKQEAEKAASAVSIRRRKRRA